MDWEQDYPDTSEMGVGTTPPFQLFERGAHMRRELRFWEMVTPVEPAVSKSAVASPFDLHLSVPLVVALVHVDVFRLVGCVRRTAAAAVAAVLVATAAAVVTAPA